MKPISKLAFGLSLLGMVQACAVAPTLDEREDAYLALTTAHFTETLSIVDDPLNPTIEMDTMAGHRDYIFSWGLKNDQFLRANIIRESGEAIIQGYVLVETTGGFLGGSTITFAHSIDSRMVDRINFDVNCNSATCVHTEHLVFDLALDEIAAAIAEADRREELTLPFRVKGQSGQDRDGRFHVNEMRAFRDAVHVKSEPH